MSGKSAAFTVMGGSILTALGFAALVTSTYISSSQLDTATFLRLWSSTIIMLALGFVTLLGGFMIGTSGRMKRIAGAILAVIASFAGAFVSLILVTTTAAIASGVINPNGAPQFALGYETLIIGTIITLFVGFPLSMFGTVNAITEREPETETSAIPS